MNRSAYFTTGFAIRLLASLSRADVVVHGRENIPDRPIIFVVNHFTRIETLLLPCHIYNLTHVPVFSLADASLFKEGLKRLFDMIGVISTRDPNRDRIIMRGLLAGTDNWIIFPEGRMVKTKKIFGSGKFMVSHENGSHPPHTGAASIALRTEFHRRHLLAREKDEPLNVRAFLDSYDIASIDHIRRPGTVIMPVNLTYYPIRAKENIASAFASRLMKEVPDRVLEELMTEGTMLFSGVDVDMRFGRPIAMDDFMDSAPVRRELQRPLGQDRQIPDSLRAHMRRAAGKMMQRYMKAIYDMTTVNHEHLFASLLQRHPWSGMKEMDLRRRVFLAAERIGERQAGPPCNLHQSLQEDQVHLLTDDRYAKVSNFLDLACDKKVVEQQGGRLVKNRAKLPKLLPFHRIRIDNPIAVMANEVEPLLPLQRLLRRLSWQPALMVRMTVARRLLRRERMSFVRDRGRCGQHLPVSQGPFLLRRWGAKTGVVLVHSYLAVPEEVGELARHLHRRGLWVYAVRLPGHGTSSADLAATSFGDWQMALERGYAIMSSICRHVVLCGISLGGALALELAARLVDLAAVVAVSPPQRLGDFSTRFMPGSEVWKRVLSRIKPDDPDFHSFTFTSENAELNYDSNPVAGVENVGSFLDKLKPALAQVGHPCLILHGDQDPVVDHRASRRIYDELGSARKQYALLHSDRHILVRGPGSERVHRLIGNFIEELMVEEKP